MFSLVSLSDGYQGGGNATKLVNDMSSVVSSLGWLDREQGIMYTVNTRVEALSARVCLPACVRARATDINSNYLPFSETLAGPPTTFIDSHPVSLLHTSKLFL